jgi:hypothetical protein
LKIDDWRNLAASLTIVITLSGDFASQGHKSCFGVRYEMSVQIARWTNILPKVCTCFHFLQFPQLASAFVSVRRGLAAIVRATSEPRVCLSSGYAGGAKMRKSFWAIFALLLIAAIGAPNAYADSVTITFTGVISGTATLTVTPESSGTFLVTAMTGTLTSPISTSISLIVPPNFFDGDDNTLHSLTAFLGDIAFQDGFGDEWLLYTSDAQVLVDGSACEFLTGCNTVGAETATFSGIIMTTPEPGTIALMLLGVGIVFAMRRRIVQRLPQAS